MQVIVGWPHAVHHPEHKDKSSRGGLMQCTTRNYKGKIKPRWWNWQTRSLEGAVPLGVEVRVLFSAPLTISEHTKYN